LPKYNILVYVRNYHRHCIYKAQLITLISSKRKKIHDMMNRSNTTPHEQTHLYYTIKFVQSTDAISHLPFILGIKSLTINGSNFLNIYCQMSCMRKLTSFLSPLFKSKAFQNNKNYFIYDFIQIIGSTSLLQQNISHLNLNIQLYIYYT